jgi:hypothetical protein
MLSRTEAADNRRSAGAGGNRGTDVDFLVLGPLEVLEAGRQ